MFEGRGAGKGKKETPLKVERQFVIYRAKWVCPVDQPPIENGAVVVDQRKIYSVGRIESVRSDGHQMVDLGDGAIIPGLVNAHTHLEFSDLTQPLGHAGMPFTDWIRLVVSSRSDSNIRSNKYNAIQAGLEESFRTGTCAIGEIATVPIGLDNYQHRNEQTLLLFLEQLGSDETLFPQKHAQLTEFVEPMPMHASTFFGASPHAPYSVHPRLLRQICSLARTQQKRVAMHIAETRDEIELIENRTGAFVSLLKDLGSWNPDPIETHRSILEILDSLSKAPRSLVVHGNYLNESEQDFIADHRAQMSVVFCPRTHQYFGHAPYPLTKMLDRKINVALGTDSRASNPDLDLFREMRCVAASFRGLQPERILEMGTLNGARALGFDDEHGSLTVGKTAAMSFVALDGVHGIRSPYESMFFDDSICTPIAAPS